MPLSVAWRHVCYLPFFLLTVAYVVSAMLLQTSRFASIRSRVNFDLQAQLTRVSLALPRASRPQTCSRPVSLNTKAFQPVWPLKQPEIAHVRHTLPEAGVGDVIQAKMPFQVHRITGDGSCMFRACVQGAHRAATGNRCTRKQLLLSAYILSPIWLHAYTL